MLVNNSKDSLDLETLSSARHDLRNPINAIIGYSEMWLEDLDPTHEERLYTLFDTIFSNGKSMLLQINKHLAPDVLAKSVLPSALGQEIAKVLSPPIHKVLKACESASLEESTIEDLLLDLEKISSSAKILLALITDPFGINSSSKKEEPIERLEEREVVDREDGPSSFYAEEGSILVVDDNTINCDLIARQCQRLGYVVTTANDGLSASRLLEREQFDLLLLDIVMPKMSGIDLLKNIRKRYTFTDLPVIMVTARDESEDIVRALDLGANDYITKPFALPVVTARVKTQLLIKKMVMALEEANQKLEALSFLDGLTGIANRRRFDNHLHEEWRRMMRMGMPLSLIMIDIDYFKKFNDTYGHETGDHVLKIVAQALSNQARRGGELVARYGGEEFAVILPASDNDEATMVAEMMRKKVESLKMVEEDHASVTISAGVCTIRPNLDVSPDLLLITADRLLYQAKKNGRNRVESIELE